MSLREAMVAFASAPSLSEVAAALPDSQKRSGPGRKSAYPVEVFLFYEMLCVHQIDATVVDAELREPHNWQLVCELFKAHMGLDLPSEAIQRRSVQTWEKHLDLDDLDTAVRPVFRRHALALARRLGQLRPEVGPTWRAVSLKHLIQGDGTWLSPWSTASVTEYRPGDVKNVDGRNTTVEVAHTQVTNSRARTLESVRDCCVIR